jgi:hypothetical protein
MVQALLWGGVAVASFAAAAVLVFAIVRVTEQPDDKAAVHRPADRPGPAARRFPRRAEPVWWPEFERAFADYVRAGDGRRS